MTMIKPIPILAVALLLAGCGGRDQAGSGSTTKPTGVAETETPFRPGLWESTIETKMAGMPPLPANVSQRCISQQESDDAAKVFLADVPGRECSAQNLTVSGGKIAGKLSCKQEGSLSTVAVSGTYTADTYDITATITGQVAGAEQPMNLQSRDRGKRLAECTPGQSTGG